MQQHLEGKLAESITFMDIPNETEVYKGKIKQQLEQTNNLLVFDLKLECRKVITAEGTEYGLL